VKKTVPMTTMKHNIGPITMIALQMAVAVMYYSCPYLLNMYFGLTFNNTFSFPFCLSPVLGPHAASARASQPLRSFSVGSRLSLRLG